MDSLDLSFASSQAGSQGLVVMAPVSGSTLTGNANAKGGEAQAALAVPSVSPSSFNYPYTAADTPGFSLNGGSFDPIYILGFLAVLAVGVVIYKVVKK